MASFNNRVNIVSGAQTTKNKFVKPSIMRTTQDFFKAKPIYTNILQPGESFSMNVQAFTRLMPLAQPFYGSCRIRNFAFFVPLRLVFEGFTNYLEDTPYTYERGQSALIQSVPKLDLHSIAVDMFHVTNRLTQLSHIEWNGSAAGKVKMEQFAYTSLGFYVDIDKGDLDDYKPFADYIRYNLNSTSHRVYKLSVKGKLFLDILRGLGYKLNLVQKGDLQTRYNPTVSALPLLCFFKVFNDFFMNPQYATTYREIEGLFKGRPTTLLADEVFPALDLCYRLSMQSDYFTSAWDNPSSPSNDIISDISVRDPGNYNSTTDNKHYGDITTVDGGSLFGTKAPHIVDKVNGQATSTNLSYSDITHTALMTLHKIYDYVIAKLAVGSRPVDRYMADYGINLDSAKMNRCVYVGKQDIEIQIGEVMQTSNDVVNGNSTPEGLGNYGGRGVGYNGDGHFEFTSDEFGFFIVISYVEPRISYADGMPRFVHYGTDSREDFFNGRLDMLGCDAIRFDELCTGFNVEHPDEYPMPIQPDRVFGFVPKYGSYKVSLDNISGDFCYPSVNKMFDGWNLYRRYDGDFLRQNNLQGSHNLEFTLGDPRLYHDMFVDKSILNDHFATQFNFDVISYAPMKPMYDIFDFEDEGKRLNMQLNGTTITD